MWQCPKCGEECDDSFDACWRCGTTREGAPPESFAVEDSAAESPYRTPQNEDAPVAASGSDRLTRQEIGSIACKVLALWWIAYGAMQALLGIVALGGMSLVSGPYRDAASGLLIYLLIPAVYLVAGFLLWLNSVWLGAAIGGKDSSPIAQAEWSPQQLLAVAFAGVGAYWLIVRLDELIKQCFIAPAMYGSHSSLIDYFEIRNVSIATIVGLAMSIALVLGCRKLAAFVYRPRPSVETADDGERGE